MPGNENQDQQHIQGTEDGSLFAVPCSCRSYDSPRVYIFLIMAWGSWGRHRDCVKFAGAEEGCGWSMGGGRKANEPDGIIASDEGILGL